MRAPGRIGLLLLVAGVAWPGGPAAARLLAVEHQAVSPPAPVEVPADPAGVSPPLATPTPTPTPIGEQPPSPAEPAPPRKARLRDLCRPDPTGGGWLVDEAGRWFEETFCGATLWLDGLFGDPPDLASARATSGRVEVSTVYTQADGINPDARLRLRYDLPNLERRVKLYLGRDDRDEAARDRQEGFAIRSTTLDIDRREEWLAGLGYSPPGRWSQRIDFRVGARLKTAPEVFLHGRWRHNYFVGDTMVWRVRDTVFWENRRGFGTTVAADLDKVLGRDLLARWGSTATYSESSHGVSWLSAAVLYHNLGQYRAVSGELFVRGETAGAVRVPEYGARAILRWPLERRQLFGDLIVGYSWPRRHADDRRQGSAMAGLALELMFGQ